MKVSNEQQFEVKKTKAFWLYWVMAALAIGLGVFLLPVWENVKVFWNTWATDGISLMLFVIVAIYIVYLGGGIKKDNPRAKNLIYVAEMILLFVLAILCLLQQFNVVNFIGPCFVIGMVLWLRGVVCALTAYMFNVKKKDRTIGVMLLSLLAVTLGTLFMVRRFTAPVFIWVISIGLIVIGLTAVAFGFLSIPQKEKNNN